MEPAEAVLKFLSSVGPGDQVEFYLRLFRSRPGASFAVIAVDETALEASVDSVAVDLRFLRVLELTPCVVLGLSDPAHAEQHRERLAARLAEDGVESAPGATGDGAHAAGAIAARGALPLLIATGDDAGTRLEGLSRLLGGLQTHKLIFLRQSGGLRDAEGERIDVVSLRADADPTREVPNADAATQRLLAQSHRLMFELLLHRLHIAVTSPLNLLHELFTVKGAGTLVRRAASVVRHEGYSGVDQKALAALLESSFGRPTRAAFFQRPVSRVYLADGYRGVAVVTDTDTGGYLTKFAVTREAQGEGIGHDLWRVLCEDHPALSWRARRDNPVRAWYERICHARVDVGEWTVFLWQVPPARIPAVVEHALAQPIDLEDVG